MTKYDMAINGGYDSNDQGRQHLNTGIRPSLCTRWGVLTYDKEEGRDPSVSAVPERVHVYIISHC